MNQSRNRVAIVGGGITGLAAAARLQADDAFCAGHVVHLYEAGETLGGVLQTDEEQGFRLERGPDSMLSRLPWGMQLCRQIGLDKELIGTNPRERGVHVVRRGRLRRVPEGLALMAPQRIWPFVTTPVLSWRGKLRLAAEPLIARRRLEPDESLADFSRRRLGREVFERLVQPLAGGIYMGDPEQLSIRATFPQFVAMEAEHGSLVRAARFNARGPSATASSEGPQYSMFVAPRRGMRQLIDRLVDHLDRQRVQIHRGQRVEQLLPDPPHGWAAIVADPATGKRRRESFAGVIVTTPAYQAAALLADVAPPLSALLDEIPYAGCVVVNLAFNRDAIAHPLDSFGFIVPLIERREVLACTFSSVKYAERAPQGKVLLRLFLGGGCRPEVLDWPDPQVLGVVGQQLRQLLGVRAAPLLSRVVRWRRSMPQYHLGHLEIVQQIEARLRQLPGLELAGNAYHGVGIPHCIRGGEQAAQRLAEAVRQVRQAST